jgi:hypothetical protein
MVFAHAFEHIVGGAMIQKMLHGVEGLFQFPLFCTPNL